MSKTSKISQNQNNHYKPLEKLFKRWKLINVIVIINLEVGIYLIKMQNADAIISLKQADKVFLCHLLFTWTVRKECDQYLVMSEI